MKVMKDGDSIALCVLGVFLCIALCRGLYSNAGPGDIYSRVMREARALELEDKYYYNSGIDKVNGSSTARQQFIANGANYYYRKEAMAGFICTQFTSYALRWRRRKSFRALYHNRHFRRFVKRNFAVCSPERPDCSGQRTSYRTVDGSCNNLRHPSWGQSGRPLKRLLSPDYSDGIGEPRRAKSGRALPNAREISNLLFAAVSEENRTDIEDPMSTMWEMQYGQFFDHDTDRTPMVPGENGSSIECCDLVEDMNRNKSCFPIIVSPNDPYFGPLNVTCLNMVRSTPADLCPPTKREQLNAVTSYIDASNVYGSTELEQKNVRLFEGGKLKTSPGKVPGKEEQYPLLPPGLEDKCIADFDPMFFCQLAGDTRVNTNPSLGSIHTSFVRDHNRLVMALADIHPDWDDEMLFQTIRKIMGAVMQHLTYAEYLPVVLGRDIMRKFGLLESSSAFNNVYNPKVNAEVVNSFATASFRFGHSQIGNFQNRLFKNFDVESVNLLDRNFNDPTVTQDGSGVDGLSVWMTHVNGGLFDRFFSFSVRNGLFFDKITKHSLDLPAINTQRGRDHGLPGYNRYRKLCGLRPFDRSRIRFDEGARADHSLDVALKLASIYECDKDIDLFVGAVTEEVLPGAHAGPLFANLLAKQFRNLKVGDRYWFENRSRYDKVGFTREQVLSIKGYSFAKVICQNHDIDRIQRNLFKQPNPDTNPIVLCEDLPDIDITLF